MRRAEQLHEEILAQMDLSKEASDEELLELIHRILEEKSKEEFIPLGEKAILGRELFNAFRKLDILQELIEDVYSVSGDTAALIRNLPEGLSPEREAVVRTACSLVGKVNYYWGGKSLVLGWEIGRASCRERV